MQNLLGLIYENENNINNACDCYFIAAEILKKDIEKWYQTYELSCKLNLVKRQQYCLTRLIRLNPDEASFYEKRYKILVVNEQYGKAAVDILQLLQKTHDIVNFISEAYELCHQSNKEPELLVYLESQKPELMRQIRMFFYCM